MMDPQAPRTHLRHVLAALLLLLACGSAWALQLAPGSQAGGSVHPNGYPFEVVNDHSQSLEGLSWQASGDYAIHCAGRTAGGAALQSAAASLQAGDRLACEAVPTSPLRQGAFAVWADAGERGRLLQTTRFGLLGSATPDQAVVAVLTGSVHDDSNGDGVLDAGESIDYHYTVLNLGNQALSGLALTDLSGPVTCPAAVLAVGAHMVCESSYVITTTDDDEGLVINDVQVQGEAANGDPVQAVDLDVTLDLGGNAGISVVKSPLLDDDVDGSGYASEGDVLAYSFVVKNTDVQTLTAVDLIEPDPTLIDGPITCAATTLAGEPFAGLATGELAGLDAVLCTATYTITAADAAAGQATNLVEASGAPAIGAPVSATGASLVTIPTGADVTIVKALTSESGSQAGVAEPGETLTYTITLTNAGGADAINYGVNDQLDPNTVFGSADNGGTHAGGVVSWTGLTVPGGGALVLTVEVTVADPLPAGTTSVANVAYEAGTTPPSCPPAGGQCVVTPTPGVVTLSKSVSDDNGNGQAEPGETLTYTITLTNAGGAAATGIELTDPLDGNTMFVSTSNGGSHAAGVVTWSNLTVPAGGSLDLTLVVTVNDPLPTGVTQIGNLVHDSSGPPPDCSASPVHANCANLPTGPDVAVSKSVSDGNGNGQAEAGETLIYTITLTNTGGGAATGYGVTDTLDPNTTFVSADNGGSHAGGTVTWTGLTVPAQVGATSGTLVLTVEVAVDSPLPDSVNRIINLAHETGTTPPDCSATPTPQGCAGIPVGVPQVAVSKTANVGVIRPGGTVVYTITVANVGTVDVSSLVVSDPIPAGIDDFAWTCTSAGGAACPQASGSGAVNQTIPLLPVGGELVYVVTAQLSDAPPDEIVNAVTVTPPETVICQPEGTPSPCGADVPVEVESGTTPPITDARPVPLNSPWALFGLLLMMLAVAGRSLRRPRQG